MSGAAGACLVAADESGSLAARSLSALAWSYAGALLRVFAQLVVQIALARLLGPTAFGQVAMVMVVLGVGWLLADSGFGSALIQKAELHDQDIAYALGWVLLLSVSIGAAVFGFAPWIADAMNDHALTPLLRTCAVLIPLQALSNIPSSLLRRRLDMRRQQMLAVGSYLLGMGVVGLALAYAGFGPWSLIIGFGVQAALILAIGQLLVKLPLKLRLSGDRGFRNFGLSVLAINLTNWSIENLDRLLVGRFWGLRSLGEYSAAGNLARAPAGMLIDAAQSVVFASSARAQDDHASLRRGYVAAACLALLVTAPVFAFLAQQALPVMQVLYGERWLNAVPLFAALCMCMPSYALLAVTGPTLMGIGAARAELGVQLLAAVLIAGGYVLLSGFPLTQAVWLVPALYALRALLMIAALARRIAIPAAQLLHSGAAGMTLMLIVLALGGSVRGLGLAPLPGALVAGGLSVLACLAALHLAARWLLPPDLLLALRERAAASALARRLCGFFGLGAEAK